VYVGGLYVEKKSNDAENLLTSPETKVLQLKFLRNVALKDIQKAWSQGYEKNCAREQCAQFQSEIQSLNALMDECKENEVLQFVFANDAVQVWKNGSKKGEVKKVGFPAQVLAIFVGAQPPNEDLKNGLLGKI
jgi:hypothetical protein